VAARVAAAVAVALLALAVLDAFVRQMLYPAPPVQVPSPPPAPFEEVRLAAGDDHAMAWIGGSRADPAAPAVLFFHGNGENLETMRRAGLYEELDALGVAWLALDYPGYGGSGGRPSQQSLTAAADAALDEARRRWPDRPVAVCGWSLGAALAVDLAARRGSELERLVAISPWTRLAELAAVHFPAPLAALAVRSERWDTLAAAERVALPALVIHGKQDALIPAAHGRAVAAALAGPTEWIEVPGAGHNDLLAYPEVWRALERFLRQAG
jgi:pimeloyl-ACP methyl ester carboxylesterase